MCGAVTIPVGKETKEEEEEWHTKWSASLTSRKIKKVLLAS
jgi:hypothetical protein